MIKNVHWLFATTCLVSGAAVPAHARALGPDPVTVEKSATDPSTSALSAQIAPSDDQPKAKHDGDIVVTGTRIKNPNLKSAAPIQSIDAQEIKLSGAVNIEDVLNRLPQVYPTNVAADQESSGVSQIQLRNFGSGHQSTADTLTLVDGLRLGGQIGVDVNAIPPALVQRVDILTGGAAAVYGPDALAGVINFILKKDFQGVQIDANYGLFNHLNRRNLVTDTADKYGLTYPLGNTDFGGRASINVTAGHRFLDDRLSLSGYFTYRHTNPIAFSELSYNACQLLQSTFDAAITCGTTRTSPYGRIIPLTGPNAGTSYINASDSAIRQFHAYTASDVTSRYSTSYQSLRSDDRYNAGGFLNLKITDWAELYGSAMYTKNNSIASYDPTSVYAGSYNGSGYTLNCANPYMSAQQAQLICGTSAGNNVVVPIDFAYRLNQYPVQTIAYQQTIKRATLGLRGDFATAWHYDLSFVYANSINTGTISANQSPNADNISKALNVISVNGTPTCVSKINGTDLNCVPFDIFHGNTSDIASYNYIFNSSPAGHSRGVGTFYDGIASISGDLGHYGITSPLATHGLQVGFNLEYRKEIQSSFQDAAYNSILAGSANSSTSSYGKQDTKEVAAELQIPLVEDHWWTKELGVSGGYRRSKYGNSASSFGTWKVEGSWAPTRDVTFRTSRNFASRAPNAYESTPTTTFNQVTGYIDPCGPTPVVNATTGKTTYTAPRFNITNCRAQNGWQDSFYNSMALLCPDSGCVFRNGNAANLGPQEANTFTYGLVLTPRFLPRFSFSIDHYKVQFVSQIVSYGPSDFDGLCSLYSVQPNALNLIGCQNFFRNANGQLFGSTNSPSTGFVAGETINVPLKRLASGYDMQGHYDFPVSDLGKASLDFNGSITVGAGDPDGSTTGGSKAGFFSTFVGDPIPKWRHNLRTTYETRDGVLSASVNWRYIGGTKAGLDYSGQLIGVPVDQLGLTGYTPPQQTFNKINPYSYFDLGFTANVNKRFSINLIVNNLLDKDPPLASAYGGLGSRSISGGYTNAITSFYDLYGRYIQLSVTTRF